SHSAERLGTAASPGADHGEPGVGHRGPFDLPDAGQTDLPQDLGGQIPGADHHIHAVLRTDPAGAKVAQLAVMQTAGRLRNGGKTVHLERSAPRSAPPGSGARTIPSQSESAAARQRRKAMSTDPSAPD